MDKGDLSSPLQRTIVTLTSQDIEHFTNIRVFNDFYQNPYRLRGLLRGMSVLRTFRAFAEHTCYRDYYDHAQCHVEETGVTLGLGQLTRDGGSFRHPGAA